MKEELKYWFFAALILLLGNTDLKAQNTVPKKVSQDEIKADGVAAAPGTYQFVVIPVEKGDPFTRDYLVMIENYRDDVQDRILPLTQYTKVRIPSRATIAKADFKPLKEIVYTPTSKPSSQSR